MITRRIFVGAILMTLSTQMALGEIEIGTHTEVDFGKYWYADGAEISRYKLTQARYGEVHNGDAVLVFVTEKLRSDIQIKADDPKDGDLPVLKLNLYRYLPLLGYDIRLLTRRQRDLCESCENYDHCPGVVRSCLHTYESPR